MDFIEAPISGYQESLLRVNTTHKTKTTYSPDGKTPIGPKAEEFFPNSPWVKMVLLEGVGHFLHMEAPDQVINNLKELLAVPLASE
jgi:hypothetical protein